MKSSRADSGRATAAGKGCGSSFHQINKQIIRAAESFDMVALLGTINHHLADMNLVNLSTAIHRIAKLVAVEVETQNVPGYRDMVRALLATMQSKLGDAALDSNLQQALSNVAWSLATLQIEDGQVLLLVADLAAEAIDGFKPFELSTLVWAVAKIYGSNGIPPSARRLFYEAANRISKDLHSFNFRSLVNIVWAYATVGERPFPLFSYIAEEMVLTNDSANCQGIANTIWAFGAAGHCDMKLFEALTEAALPIMNNFKAQELSSMLWGLAISGFVKETFLTASLDAILLMDLGPQQLANIVWAYAKLAPNHSMTHVAIVHLLPRITEMFVTFKVQEVASVMQALARVAAMDCEDANVPNGAWLLPSPVYKSISAFLRFAMPWIKEHLVNLPCQIFTSVVCVHELFGFSQDGTLGQLVEQQVIARVDSLPCEEIIPLLRVMLSSRAPSQAVRVLAGKLASCFPVLQPRQKQQLQQLSMLTSSQVGLQVSADETKLYSWCRALAVTQPKVTQGSIDEDEPSLSISTRTGKDEPSLSMSTHTGKAKRTPELLELQDLWLAHGQADCGDSILSLDHGEFTYECRLTTDDSLSLPSFPNTPEDSDDEYHMALIVQ